MADGSVMASGDRLRAGWEAESGARMGRGLDLASGSGMTAWACHGAAAGEGSYFSSSGDSNMTEEIDKIRDSMVDLLVSAMVVKGFVLAIGDRETDAGIDRSVAFVLSSVSGYLEESCGIDSALFLREVTELSVQRAQEHARLMDEARRAMDAIQATSPGETEPRWIEGDWHGKS